MLVPHLEWNPCPLQWEHGVLTTGLPGKSDMQFFKKAEGILIILRPNLSHLYRELAIYLISDLYLMGFPCGSAGKEPSCNAGDRGLIPGLA